MKAPMQLPVRQVRSAVNAFFESGLRDLQMTYTPQAERERIYLKSFDTKLMLERFGMLSQTVVDLFNEMTILVIGTDVDAIHELSGMLAENNMRKQAGEPVERELTPYELAVVTHYHQYLFAKRVKNPTPFSHDI